MERKQSGDNECDVVKFLFLKACQFGLHKTHHNHCKNCYKLHFYKIVSNKLFLCMQMKEHNLFMPKYNNIVLASLVFNYRLNFV